MNSGRESLWKIDTDALVWEDWRTLALMIKDHLPPFGRVVGVPTGGLEFARALETYRTDGPLLIVDDVLTTGKSMERLKQGLGEPSAIGAVVFARGDVPPWVTPLFTLTGVSNPWQDAIIDAHVVNFSLMPEYHTNPRKALGDLITHAVEQSFDPLISLSALELMAKTIARDGHYGQYTKYDSQPYIKHV